MAASALTGVWTGAGAGAASAREQAAERKGNLSAADRKFLDDAYSINEGEIMLGRLAQQNGASQAVKDYGQRTISDHTKALEAEKQVAMQVGVSLPTEVDAMTRAQYDELSRKTGRDFDTAYSDAMVSGHEAAVREFGGEATTGTNAAVKAYAQYELPMLRDHLRLARELSQQRRRPRPLPRARRTVRRPPRNCRSRR